MIELCSKSFQQGKSAREAFQNPLNAKGYIGYKGQVKVISLSSQPYTSTQNCESLLSTV